MENVNGGVDNKKYIIETTGSGVAILDYDNDGWPDILLVNGTTLDEAKGKTSKPTSHLFHNNHDGTFTDVTQAAGLAFTGWGQGACVGDYDNDGFDDLYVTYYGKSRLYHNEGNGTFKEVAGAAGVAGDGKAWGTGCAFVDYDRDGKLDLLVANYRCPDGAQAWGGLEVHMEGDIGDVRPARARIFAQHSLSQSRRRKVRGRKQIERD